MPPGEPPASPPEDVEGVGTTAGAGAVVGAGGAAGAGVVVGVVGAGAVDPDPEPVAPPAGGTVTGLVGVGAGTGRGTGTGALLDEPRDGMVTGDERTGIEGSGNAAAVSETRSALVTLAADVTDGTTTAAAPAAPEAYEVGRAVEPAVPHTALPAVAGVVGAGPVTGGAGAGVGVSGPTGAVLTGAAIRPDQSEAE
jgi:hypothetical protein